MCPNCQEWWLWCCVYNCCKLTSDPNIVACHLGVTFCVNKKVRAVHNNLLVWMTSESISDKLARAGIFGKIWILKVFCMFCFWVNLSTYVWMNMACYGKHASPWDYRLTTYGGARVIRNNYRAFTAVFISGHLVQKYNTTIQIRSYFKIVSGCTQKFQLKKKITYGWRLNW